MFLNSFLFVVCCICFSYTIGFYQRPNVSCEVRLRKVEEMKNKLPDVSCQENGDYAPLQCTVDGSRCSCVDPMGNKLRRDTKQVDGMNCKCARDQYDAGDKIGVEFNCDAVTGNYLPIQCLGSECYCADENGEMVGNSVPRADSKSLECE